MLIAFIMGFAGGLPLFLTGSLFQAWLKTEGVDLATIGLFALVGIPYTIKFMWAPLMDRFSLTALGRRRGWLMLWQLALTLSIVMLAFSDPGNFLMTAAIAALLLSFFSASQDIVIDAYRRESLNDDEQSMGASLFVAGYRVGILLATGGGLILAEYIPYSVVYLLMATVMACCILATILAPEPKMQHGQPTSLREAILDPLVEYFTRHYSVAILLFIFLYKVGDTMAGQMTTPFYLELGFSTGEIGKIVKLFGFWATIAGSMIGGVLIMRIGIYKGLMWFGVLQALSTAGFAWLYWMGHDLVALGAVVTFENLSAGLGTAAFVGFMASLTDKRFTATQFALLTSFMGMPRVFAAAPTGFLAEAVGWSSFFITCALIAIPGLILLYWLNQRLHQSAL